MEDTLQINILLSRCGCPGFLISLARLDGVPIHSIYSSQLSEAILWLKPCLVSFILCRHAQECKGRPGSWCHGFMCTMAVPVV